MELKTMFAVCAILGLALLASAPLVSGVCCRTKFNVVASLCADCRRPKGYYCGRGPCNIVGCNCDDGCITGPCAERKKRSVDDAANGTDTAAQLLGTTGHEVVLMADKNGDGMLNIVELKVFLEKSGVQVGSNEWLELDINRDGKLTAHEIDHDL